MLEMFSSVEAYRIIDLLLVVVFFQYVILYSPLTLKKMVNDFRAIFMFELLR